MTSSPHHLIPPHNLDAERAVLGAILLEGRDTLPHARPMSFWRAGVEVATGRRIHMTIMSPSQLLDTLPKRDLTPEMGTITP